MLAHNEPADPENAFKNSDKLRSHGVEIITVAIHTKKTPSKLNPQFRALASSGSNAHSFDYDNLVNSSIDVVLNMCEFNTCPTGKSSQTPVYLHTINPGAIVQKWLALTRNISDQKSCLDQ